MLPPGVLRRAEVRRAAEVIQPTRPWLFRPPYGHHHPGVIAAVSETLAEAGVSIESFLQKPVENAEGVPIVLTTHAVAESVLTAAIDRIANLPAVLERPRLLRIARI